ncbi:hypothetical protein [Streptomyces sp. NPDC001315]|uniref:hypothetical protein n=1 Tax=Streptomyces sp. NPDC001315 TaxID=3364562 RepID=UPI00368BA0DA
MAAVGARVQRVSVTSDDFEVLSPAACAEARHLFRYADADPADLEVAYVLGRLHYRRALALPRAVAEQDREATIRLLTKCFIAGREDLPQPLLAALAEAAVHAAQDLTNAIVMWPRGALPSKPSLTIIPNVASIRTLPERLS